MSSFTNSKKADAQPSLSTSTSNDAADGENKTAAAQSANERPSYHTENIGSTPSSRRAPEDVANRNQNASGSSPPRRVAWTAVRTHPSGEASSTKYLDDGAFVASGSRPTPPPAPEPFKAAEFPTQRDEELMEKGEKLELHDGKGHGDVVDEVVYKGRGKAGGKEVGGVGSKGDKVGEKKQETVAGKKKFGSFNAMLYGPPAVDGNNEKKQREWGHHRERCQGMSTGGSHKGTGTGMILVGTSWARTISRLSDSCNAFLSCVFFCWRLFMRS